MMTFEEWTVEELEGAVPAIRQDLEQIHDVIAAGNFAEALRIAEAPASRTRVVLRRWDSKTDDFTFARLDAAGMLPARFDDGRRVPLCYAAEVIAVREIARKAARP